MIEWPGISPIEQAAINWWLALDRAKYKAMQSSLIAEMEAHGLKRLDALVIVYEQETQEGKPNE